MTTYNSYEAAKVANPESEIWGNTTPSFGVKSEMEIMEHSIFPCDIEDYCMTVEKFLADGHKFVGGDICLDHGSVQCLVAEVYRDGYSYWIVQFKDNFHPFDLSELSKPETKQQREDREREELSDLACESLFGESIQNCRPDVAATVRSMIEAGYRNDKINNQKSSLY